jgi:hypothetical protein
MKKLLLLIVLLPGFLNTSVFAGDISVNGYYKLFFTGFKLPPYRFGESVIKEPPIGAVNNRLRLKLTASFSARLSLNVSYDFSPRIQDPSLFEEDIFFAAIDTAGYRVDDFENRIYPAKNDAVGSFGIFHNLDRCFITIKTPKADIFIGRQAIAWGSAKFINPTDVIAPFTFNELDTEERKGVDAVRVRIPLGMMDELDIGYIFGRDFKFERSAFFIRGKFYLLKTDFSLLLLGFRENLLLGLDIARSIGGAGFWLEAAYVLPDTFGDSEHPVIPGKNYFRASIGMDYNFSGKTYGFFEYHFNSAGKVKARDYQRFFYSTAFLEGSAYLMAKHYLNLGITYQVTPLLPFTGLVILNLNDGSVTAAPSLEYNIAENIYISAGAYLGFGKRPGIRRTEPPGNPAYFNSEFGAYPNMFYTSFRIYF